MSTCSGDVAFCQIILTTCLRLPLVVAFEPLVSSLFTGNVLCTDADGLALERA